MLRYFLGVFKRNNVMKVPNPVRYFRGTHSRMDFKKVHVTFGTSKRIMSYPEDDGVKNLRHHFLRSFSDILSEDVAVANVKFQRYDDAFEEYIDLENDAKLDDEAKVKVVLISKYKIKESSYSDYDGDDLDGCFAYAMIPEIRVPIPMYTILKSLPSDLKFHPIKKDVPYRLWNHVSNGLIQRSPEKSTIITCSGGFNDPDTVIKAESFGSNFFYLAYTDPGVGGSLYLTAKGENDPIVLSSTQSDEALFEPVYYWGCTLFRNRPWSNLYLGCDANRLATLVHMENVNYPNPQALFTVNEYKLDFSSTGNEPI